MSRINSLAAIAAAVTALLSVPTITAAYPSQEEMALFLVARDGGAAFLSQCAP